MNSTFSKLCYLLILSSILVTCKKNNIMSSITGSWAIYEIKTSEGIKETRQCNYCFQVYVAHGITFKNDMTYNARYFKEDGTWVNEEGVGHKYEVGGNTIILHNNESESDITEKWIISKRTEKEIHLENTTGEVIHLTKTE